MERFIVRDASGNWQASYNVAIGMEQARASAVQCASRIKGVVFTSGADAKETKIFDATSNTQNNTTSK